MARKTKVEDGISEVANYLYVQYYVDSFERTFGYRPEWDDKRLVEFREGHRHEFEWPAIMIRLNDYYGQCKDLAQVQLVSITALRNAREGFNPLQSLSTLSLMWMKDVLHIPPGGWKYFAWAEALTEGRRKRSADYWLGLWQDEDESGALSDENEKRYKGQVEKLMRMPDDIGFDEVEEVDEL